jgi:hypothetical protein
MLSVVHAERHIQALYAEYLWAECRGALYLSVILNIKQAFRCCIHNTLFSS